MTDAIKQLLMKLLFACVLGTVFVLGYAAEKERQLKCDESLKRYGFYLEEVSKQYGIDFVHQRPRLDPKLDHIMPIVAAMGASVSAVDFDRDGWLDLYVVNSGTGTKNCLYRNKGVDGNGTPLGFEEVAEPMGVADLNKSGEGACMGAVWGDFDNDGFEDLFVYRWGQPELFRNKGVDKDRKPLGFERVTERAGLSRHINAGSAIWLDFDGDGYLDLFIAGYWADDVDLWNLKTTKIMPESFQYANNGGNKYLFRNRGDGTFEDVAEQVGIKSTRWTLAVAAADLRGTGYPDLVLANDYGVNEFFANKQGKKFVEMGGQTQIGDKSKSGMSVSFGDIHNRGRLSIYTTNISEPGVLLQGNNLWVPDLDKQGEPKKGDDLTYTNLAAEMGVDLGGWSWGAHFGDFNNDGRMDLICTSGYVSSDRNANSYWFDYSQIAGANSNIIQDAATWPKMRNYNLSGFQQHCLWLNKGVGFVNVCQAVGMTDTLDGRSIVLVDLWNRGMLDIVQAAQNQPLLVYKNTVARDNDWIQFELEGSFDPKAPKQTGRKSNRSAIGAQVKVYWNDQVQLQEVSGGSGYASHNPRRLHFGLGKDAHVDHVEIRWPSGWRQTIDGKTLETKKLNRIKEPS